MTTDIAGGSPVVSRFERTMAISPSAGTGYDLETILPPASLYGANGIRVGPDGRLWICEAFARRVSSVDTRTGELETVISMDGSLLGPDDLAFDDEGTAYIADGNRIAGRRADGTLFTLVDGLEHPNGITVDNEGRLYVDEFRMGGRLLEIDRHSGEVRVIAEGLDLPNACERGPDGRLYLQNVIAGTISAVDVETGEVEQVAEGLKRVSSVKFDPRGRVVASQADLGIVTAIDLQSGEWETVARMPHRTIDNLAFDLDGTLFVSNYSTGCIVRVAPGGDADGEILVPPGLTCVSSLAALADDALLVANFFTVVTVDAGGTFAEWCPWSPLSGEEVLQAAWPIDADHAHVLTRGGQVYRCERGQSCADVKSALAAAAPEARGALEVADGGALAITGADGGLLIAFAGGEVRRVSSDGADTLAASTGQEAIDALTVAGGVIAAADTNAGTVAVVRDGAVEILTGFARPSGIALAGGDLFVAELGSRSVVRCGLDDGTREIIASDLAFGSPIADAPAVGGGVSSLLAREDGSLLIGSDGDASIRRLLRR